MVRTYKDEDYKVVVLDGENRRIASILETPVAVHVAASQGCRLVAVIDPDLEKQTINGIPVELMFDAAGDPEKRARLRELYPSAYAD